MFRDDVCIEKSEWRVLNGLIYLRFSRGNPLSSKQSLKKPLHNIVKN